MAEPQHVTVIEQGVEVWNRWRDDHPDINPDLSQVYLFEANLRGANFSHTNLNRACLIGANLKQSNLKGANLSGAYGNGADFSEANLTAADLKGANFSEAIFTNADLSEAQTLATNFASACLTGVCLENWHPDRKTQLDAVECDYVYLQRQHRYPMSGQFSPGEFAQWVQENLLPATLPGVQGVTAAAVIARSPAADVPQPSVAPAADAEHSPPPLPLAISSRRALPQTAIIAMGIVVGIAAILTAIALFRNTRHHPSVSSPPPELPLLPCNEPPPPPLPQGAPDYEYPSGIRYYGKQVGGVPADGRGMMVFKNGDRYDGNYRDGKRNGCGTFTFANRRRYIGEFQDDQFAGRGIWMLENGDRYVGDFKDNRCHGAGTFLWADGSSKSGQWQNGTLVGGNLSCNRPLQGTPDASN